MVFFYLKIIPKKLNGFRMKKVIDGVASGPVNLVLCEILASFIFVSCIMEKGLWYANVNENYFHFATAAQANVLDFSSLAITEHFKMSNTFDSERK